MYIIKNAIANLRRNIGRNLLSAIVLFVIILIAAISIIIHTTSTLMIDDYKQRFGSEVHVNRIQGGNKDQLDTATLLSFADSELLQSKQYFAKSGYVPKNLQALDDDGNPATLKGYLLGSSRKDINDEFQKGSRKLIKGSLYKTANECIISKQFAQLNHLDVQDTLTLQGNDPKKPSEITLTISGIYEDVSIHSDANAYTIALNNRSNEIFASFETVMESALFQNYGTLDIKMYLKDPALLPKLQQELTAKGLPDSYEVTTDEKGYQKLIAPVEHIADISSSMMLAALVLGAFLLILISIMVMKERTYEIGVLRAIGMKKKQVVYGLLCEVFMITSICLTLALCCAQFASKPIGNMLLHDQQSSKETTLQTQSEKLALNPSLTMASITKISMIALTLALIAGAGSIAFTIRYEPMRILSEKKQ